MKPLNEILSTLKTDVTLNLPGRLTAAGLDDFELYHIGTSRNADALGLFIYADIAGKNYELDTVTIIFQLQLYQKSELEAARYYDVFEEYIYVYPPKYLGCDSLAQIDMVSTWPPEKTSTTYTYVLVSWVDNKDNCD